MKKFMVVLLLIPQLCFAQSSLRKHRIDDGAGNNRQANVTASKELNVLDSNSTAIKTAVEIIDDWDESNRAKVNPIAGQAGIAAGAGVDGATVPRATLATDAGLLSGAPDRGYFQITDGTNSPDIVSVEGEKSIRVVPGLSNTFTVHIGAIGVASETAYMLIDLSDTTNWPHSNTGHVNIIGVAPVLTPNNSFRGDVTIGFLTNVDATNGDMNVIHGWHFVQASGFINGYVNWSFSHVEGEVVTWFGPTKANNTNFQTDVNLAGPDGTTVFPSGDGDVVMLVERTAGTIDVGLTVLYKTIE